MNDVNNLVPGIKSTIDTVNSIVPSIANETRKGVQTIDQISTTVENITRTIQRSMAASTRSIENAMVTLDNLDKAQTQNVIQVEQHLLDIVQSLQKICARVGC